MHRLFTFLIISVLFSQSAWAFHDVEFNLQQDEDAIYSLISEQNEASVDYDHCGHASAHLVGLLSSITLDTYVAPSRNIISVNNLATSISYQPPVPPPTL